MLSIQLYNTVQLQDPGPADQSVRSGSTDADATLAAPVVQLLKVDTAAAFRSEVAAVTTRHRVQHDHLDQKLYMHSPPRPHRQPLQPTVYALPPFDFLAPSNVDCNVPGVARVTSSHQQVRHEAAGGRLDPEQLMNSYYYDR